MVDYRTREGRGHRGASRNEIDRNEIEREEEAHTHAQGNSQREQPYDRQVSFRED